MRIKSSDVAMSAEEYVRLVAEAVEARVRLMLAHVGDYAVLRAPEDVADAVARYVEAEQVRLTR